MNDESGYALVWLIFGLMFAALCIILKIFWKVSKFTGFYIPFIYFFASILLIDYGVLNISKENIFLNIGLVISIILGVIVLILNVVKTVRYVLGG